MVTTLRQSTLQAIGLGTVLEMFERGGPPMTTGDLVDRVFGNSSERGSLVISGANGIVGAGKTMQLGARLEPFGVPVVALDLAGAPDGIGKQYPGLARAFGRERADRIMQNIVRMSYDGRTLPAALKEYRPRFLLEAVPEILDLKKAHYEVFRAEFPEIQIRSVTSGFPSSQLGVGIAHPAFPHQINKLWEIVEPETSAVTQLLWSLGLIPLPVSDNWSFVLDVLFCGLTLAALRYHHASNMPYWKIDKFTRKILGPNPLRAHDAIGAKGADFLTWSCLHHLAKEYGELFTPTTDLAERKDSGQDWYPPNHFRPLVNWTLDSAEEQELETWIVGPLVQMTSIMLHEKRAHLAHMNIIGELCAQFTRGIVAVVRSLGAKGAVDIVEAYHKLHPEAATSAWYPNVFENMNDSEWQQLYVNAEHDGSAGVITIGRESYSHDVDAEINRAIDWLKSAGIERVIVAGDFHLSTQMVGADTSEFFAAVEDEEKGFEISHTWSATARRLYDEFETSVGFVSGKRCWGGMLELLTHCHYVVSVDDATFAFPEVTLPVVPGMEGCHWPFRKADEKDWPKLFDMLLEGSPVSAADAAGWMVDFAGPLPQALKTTWGLVTSGDHGLTPRAVRQTGLDGIAKAVGSARLSDDGDKAAAQRAILDSVQASCEATLSDALTVQARHSAGFMSGELFRNGAIGTIYRKTVKV
jgi:enoyl-CoA hydratase/carnithine racemase/3-hydroxyacyl-CoA dehydrogenase